MDAEKKRVISFTSLCVCAPPDAQLVRADAPKTMRQSVVNFNGELTSSGRGAPTPVRQTAADQKLLFRSFQKLLSETKLAKFVELKKRKV